MGRLSLSPSRRVSIAGGRKLIVATDSATVPRRKPARRDPGESAGEGALLAAPDGEQIGLVGHQPGGGRRGVTVAYVSGSCRLTSVAPDFVEVIMDGRQR